MNIIYFFISFIFGTLPFFIIAYVVYRMLNKKQVQTETDKFEHISYPSHIMVLTLLLVLAYNLLLYKSGLGLGAATFLTTLLCILFFAIPLVRRSTTARILLLTGILASLMTAVRANGALQSFNILYVLAIAFIFVLIKTSSQIHVQGLFLIKLIGDYFYYVLRNIPLLPKYRSNQNNGTNISVVGIVKIILFTTIVVFVFTEILSGADPIFASIIENIKVEAFSRVLLSTLISALFISLISVHIKESDHRELKLNAFSNLELLIPTIAVVLLFFVFIAVQIKYLFLGHLDIQAFGLTYSDYVRKGFIELIVATILGGLMVYFLYLKKRMPETASHAKSFIIINTLLVLELFVLLASALKRNLIYIEMYGLTRTRFIGNTLLVWIAVFLALLLIINVSKTISETKMLKMLGMLTIVILTFLNAVNIDQIISSHRPPSDSENPIDYYYINNLSEDAVNGWENSIHYSLASVIEIGNRTEIQPKDKEILANVKLAMISLKEKRDALIIQYGSHDSALKLYAARFQPLPEIPEYAIEEFNTLRRWQSFNVSEYSAYKRMSESPTLFYDTVDCIIHQIYSVQKEKQLYLSTEEYRILYETDRAFVNTKYPNHYQPNEVLINPDSPSAQEYIPRCNLELFD